MGTLCSLHKSTLKLIVLMKVKLFYSALFNYWFPIYGNLFILVNRML